jgi:hypothetical protein
MAVCADERPAAIEVAPGQSSACWLHAKGLTAAQSRPLREPATEARPLTGPVTEAQRPQGPGEEKR